MKCLPISGMLGCLFAMGTSVNAQGGTRAEWREVWEAFADHYSYFEAKGVDWDQHWQDHQSDFDEIDGGVAFARQLSEQLLVLRDWHVFVRDPNGVPRGFNEPVAFNFLQPTFFYPQYLARGSYDNLNNAGAIIHGWLRGEIAHIVVVTLGARFTENIDAADIDALFARYQGAQAMVVDLRANGGGNELNARALAGRWIDEPREYGFVRTRDPALGREGFSSLHARELEPVEGQQYHGPVIGLIGEATISSAESFALMIRALPQGVLIGDTTRGASGNPIAREVSSLGVTYSVSTWQAFDAEEQLIEGHGVVPDWPIAAAASYDDDHDYVLEAAIDLVARRGDTELPLSWILEHGLAVSPQSDADGDGLRDVDEFLAGTDPRDAGSVLALRNVRRGDDTIHFCVTGGAAATPVVVEWSEEPSFRGSASVLEGSGTRDGDDLCFEVEIPGDVAARFFRVRLRPQD